MTTEPENEWISTAEVAHKAAVAILDLHEIEAAVGNHALQGLALSRPLEYIVSFDTADGKLIGAKVFFWPKETTAR